MNRTPLNRLARTSICALAVSGGLLGLSSGSALARDYTIHLSGPASAVVGQPVVIEASGIHPPPSDWAGVSWIGMSAIPASVMPTCPADKDSGIGVATGAGGDLLAIADSPNLDSVGNYDNFIGWTPRYAGQWLICGYQDDGAGYTFTHDQITVSVGNPAATPAAAPANVKRPKLARKGKKLVCSPGRWSNATGGYGYGWLVGGKAKKGASGHSLRVTHALRGRKVQCSVTASGPGGKTSAVSAALRVRP